MLSIRSKFEFCRFVKIEKKDRDKFYANSGFCPTNKQTIHSVGIQVRIFSARYYKIPCLYRSVKIHTRESFSSQLIGQTLPSFSCPGFENNHFASLKRATPSGKGA